MPTSRYIREATKRLAPAPALSGISGLIRWYRADTLALADGSLVSTWPDESGNGADLAAAGGARPTLMQGRLNGKPSVVFAGAQKLARTDTGGPSADMTVFAVVANRKRQTDPVTVAWGNGGSAGVSLFGNSSADANEQPPSMIALRSGGAWGDNQATATAKPARGDAVILTGLVSGTTTKIRVDKGNEVTDTGDAGTLDYGVGTVELSLGNKGSGAGKFQGEIFEVLIFSRALNPTEIATVEDYLDQKWRVTTDHASLFALYNGSSAASPGADYQIGLSWSADGRRWRRSFSNPVLTKSGSGWERDLVKDPTVLFDGTEYVLYYSGWTSATGKFQIGRATSTDLVTWTRDSHNPVIGVGAGGSVDEGGCSFPTVVYDLAESDPSRRWKMWYDAHDGSGKETVAYAYSADGISWTKYGKVLDVGAAGTWDAIGVAPGCAYRDDDGTWYLFYQGRKNASAPSRWQGGVATFTNPESTYTKYGSNPTMKARFNDSGASAALTANTASGSSTVTVASTAGFNVHEPVFLDRLEESTSEPEFNRVGSIDSSTQITLEWPVEHTFPTSDSARIVSAAYNSVIPRAIRKLADGSYELHAIPFQPVDDVSHSSGNTEILREMALRGTVATLTSQTVYDYASGLSMMLQDVGRWDELSAENFATAIAFVPAAFAVVPFIASRTVVYAPTVEHAEIAIPFIASVTVAYAPTLIGPLIVPFISSATRVFGVFSLFTDIVRVGPGNGGETALVRLAPAGSSVTATLAAPLSSSGSLLELTGDSGLPTSEPFVVAIDAEQVYVIALGGGLYRIRDRGIGNTTPASHLSGASASWGDSFDMAVTATENINASFTADVNGSGSHAYPGWLICFDSSQAYLSGDRYPMHVTEVVGVFAAGAGTTGTNRLDGPQPNAISTAVGVSDDCPAALSNPARIDTDIVTGDVAVVRFTNPAVSALDLGPRSVALQSWFGIKRVDDTDNDVTFTDPGPPDSGGHGSHAVDTIPGVGPFTGSVNGEWTPPVSGPGISPSTGLPTVHDVPFTSVTLPGADRYFTDGIHYSEKGWPICCLAVRQGKRRVPFWESWDWHDFNFVYCGFGVDDTYAQLLVNRNGMVFGGGDPTVALPGSQDIDGPTAVWDDGSYYFGVSWYVAIWQGPYLVLGPSIGGDASAGLDTGPNPVVTFPPGGPAVVFTPAVSGPPPVEGGSGGGINPPGQTRFDVAII